MQVMPSRQDFNKPVKLYERPNDFMKRSMSLAYIKPSLPTNPEKTSPSVEMANSKALSNGRMSSIGAASLSKLPKLDNDKEVYVKQRQGRDIDIISPYLLTCGLQLTSCTNI